MSDFIYCPVCDARVSIDEASYFQDIPEDRQEKLRFFEPKLSAGDMVCSECEADYEE